MVFAVCDVPVIWEADSWKTFMGFTLVDKLWRKVDSCKRCGKNSYYLLFVEHPNNLDSFRSFLLHGPWWHWYIVDTGLVPVSDGSLGISSISATTLPSTRTFISSKFCTVILALVLALCLTEPMRVRRCLPQCFVREICLLFDPRTMLSLLPTISSAHL